jgi:uncharacterized protein (DUF1697 family)
MALVVLLRGINVGGHRTFRPATLAKQLEHLDAVNIGAAGNFLIRQPITAAQLCRELVRRLPFETDITIFPGREIVSMVSSNPFAREPVRSDVVRFVSVLSGRSASAPSMPMTFPPNGK